MQAPDRLAGRRAKCKCGAFVAIPDASAEVEPAELDWTAGDGLPPAGSPAAHPAVCPNCLADLAAGAVLCTTCGFNLKTGKQLAVSTGDSPEKAVKPPRADGRPRSGGGSRHMRGIARISVTLSVVKWVIIIGVVVGGAWGVRQAFLFDPHKQALEAEAKIYPGMTVQEVIDAIGKEPAETHAFEAKELGNTGYFIELVDKRIAYQDNFMNTVEQKIIENGFYFVYWYSERDKLTIRFDSEGTVEMVELVDPPSVLGF